MQQGTANVFHLTCSVSTQPSLTCGTEKNRFLNSYAGKPQPCPDIK